MTQAASLWGQAWVSCSTKLLELQDIVVSQKTVTVLGAGQEAGWPGVGLSAPCVCERCLQEIFVELR